MNAEWILLYAVQRVCERMRYEHFRQIFVDFFGIFVLFLMNDNLLTAILKGFLWKEHGKR